MSIERAWSEEIQQAVFRLLLEATSRPGRIFDLGPSLDGLPALQAILATVIDGSVSLHDRCSCLHKREWNFLQTRQVEIEQARFILASADRSPDFTPDTGTLESPETGATILLGVKHLGQGPVHLTCTGPGIETEHVFRVEGLQEAWLQAREDWNSWFPLGVDIYLVDSGQVCALPRTTRVRKQGA